MNLICPRPDDQGLVFGDIEGRMIAFGIDEDDIRAVLGLGFQGPEGRQGPPGIFDTFPFYQLTPAAVWNIPHGLNRYPSITVIDSANSVVEGDEEYIDANNIRITFRAAFAGAAYLN